MSGNKKKTSETNIVKIDELSLEENQLAEQLYHSAGLDPVVEAGLKDYDLQLKQESKLLNRMLGPSQSDIRGYGQAVAKRVAQAIYALLSRQYGGKVGDLRSYIMEIEDERDRANTRYDELMGRVVGILGEEYKQLRTDSNTFMEKLTTVLGDDLEASKINQEGLASRLADIDGLRARIKSLEDAAVELEKKYGDDVATLKERQQQKIVSLREKHKQERDALKAGITGLNLKLEARTAIASSLEAELGRQTEAYKALLSDLMSLTDRVPSRDIGEPLGTELRDFLLEDSKVPHLVIDGVGKFIDFKKYLALAADRGAADITGQLREILGRQD